MRSIVLAILLCALSCCQARQQQQVPVTSYKREITLYNTEIILSRQVISRRGSLVYAACQQAPEYFFDRLQCNVTIESPSFANSVDNNTCDLHFVPESPRAGKLTELKLHLLNEHKVLFSWSVKNATNNWHTNLRILTMASCHFHDLSLPVRGLAHVITHKSGFDLVLNYHSFCRSTSHCKLSYDANGKRLAGPIKILYDSDVPVLIPRVQPFLDEGFLLADLTPRGYVVKIEPDGRLKPLMAIDIPRDRTLRATVSSLYGFYSLCAFVNSTTLTCYMYDPRVSFRVNATLESNDRENKDERWIATRNLRGRSLILATGKLSAKGRNVDDFTVIKLHSDGRWGRAIKIRGIDFKGVDEFHARMTRNKLDELCFHFVGRQNKSHQQGTINRLKYAIKCLSKSYVNADNLVVVH